MFTSPFQVQQERKTAGRLASRPGLPYNAGFVGELAGKRVYHGNCGPNPPTAGHLGCLNKVNLQRARQPSALQGAVTALVPLARLKAGRNSLHTAELFVSHRKNHYSAQIT